MKKLNKLFLIFCLFFSLISDAKSNGTEIILVGSTPGYEEIKSMLAIPATTKIDFIKWNLKMTDKSTFSFDIHFGESQANTMGFIGGGEKRPFNGTFSISKNIGKNNFKEVYDLEGVGINGKISLAKLNENVFHILTRQNELMNGNGGWSYSLNRKNPPNSGELLVYSTISGEKSLQMIFDGRTPCQEIANEHSEMKVSDQCFKLKWRLILNNDATTYEPTTYVIRKVVDGKRQEVTGKWSIIFGTTKNPNSIIYKIEADKPEESISLLVGDDNVLFFLNKSEELYLGNENYSFSVNKKYNKRQYFTKHD